MAEKDAQYQTVTEELSDYWNRRPNLSKKEWERFFLLVRASLMNCSAPQLKNLPEDREVYVLEFFEEKIYTKVQRTYHELQVGALREFFRRFLITKIRLLPNTIQMSSFDDDDGGETFASSIPDPNPGNSLIVDFLNETPKEALLNFVDEFIAGLEQRHCRMLVGHYCSDKPIPMYKLFAGVNGYDYQAQRLGVKGGYRLGYENTLIGKWMQSIGVSPSSDNLELVHFLLKVLCQRAEVRHAQGPVQC